MVGPRYAIPVVGAIVEMVKNPYQFWENQRLWGLKSPNGLSWNSIAGQFTLFSTNTETTKTIFMNNGPDSFKLFLHPNGWQILGMNNIAFKHGNYNFHNPN
jgi:sterol 22-desaturase